MICHRLFIILPALDKNNDEFVEQLTFFLLTKHRKCNYEHQHFQWLSVYRACYYQVPANGRHHQGRQAARRTDEALPHHAPEGVQEPVLLLLRDLRLPGWQGEEGHHRGDGRRIF